MFPLGFCLRFFLTRQEVWIVSTQTLQERAPKDLCADSKPVLKEKALSPGMIMCQFLGQWELYTIIRSAEISQVQRSL